MSRGLGPEDPTPRWVWALIITLALSQPLLLVWIRYAPPEGATPTGLHIPDSALFLHSMGMFDTRFESLYATCQSEQGTQSMRFYAVPHLWLYGLLGVIAVSYDIDPYLFYGLANGAGVFLYLWVVYRLLREIVPRYANASFLLYTLSGGPGGILFLVTGLLGLHDSAAFTTYFTRFALYDLMEGPNLNPALYYPRLYYTLSLTVHFGALLAAIRGTRMRSARLMIPWAFPVLAGSFINARYAVFTVGILFAYLVLEAGVSRRLRWLIGLGYGVPAAAGVLISSMLMRSNPAVVDNHLQVASMAMWLSPFLMVTWLHLVIAARPLRDVLKRMPRGARLVAHAAVGYTVGYALLYLLYQGYYGNLLTGRDGSVAAVISDWALIGAGAAVIRVLWRRFHLGVPNPYAWLSLWFFVYGAVSLSGWGQGWFLRFGPQRLEVFLWFPLCLFTAVGLARLRPRWARIAWAVLLFCGITSVLVAFLAFQGPLGRTFARGPYPEAHAEIMSQTDADVLDFLESGVVLAPSPAGDVVVQRHGNPVVFGVGTFNLTDLPYTTVKGAVDEFFRAGAPSGRRESLARKWCVDYVFCPDTWPVPEATVTELRATSWLEEVATRGKAVLFKTTLHADMPALPFK